jgi:hypothetical protein
LENSEMKNSSTSGSKPKLKWHLFTGAVFLAGLFALVIGINHQGRPAEKNRDIWYGPVIDYIQQGGRFSYLFVGTSRTRAAIRPDVFDTVMTRTLGSPTLSINLGMGWCRMSEHYFGLRRLLEVQPGILRGVVVFLEAPSALPEYSIWKSDWIVTDRTDLLTPYIHKSDLWKLWREATTPTDMKFVITANLVAPFMEYLPRVRQYALPALDSLLQGFFSPLTSLAQAETEVAGSSDLTTEGGIRADAKGVETARELATRMARDETVNQDPWNDFDKTIVAEILKMVKNAGGYVVFLDMPLSDIQQAPYDTPLRQRERADFTTTLKAWNCIMLHPQLQYDSTDFPDLWHLRKTRAPEFTFAVANSFIEAAKAAGGK